MVYGYIRVSTDHQDCKNQKLGIEAKATALGLSIDKYIEDAGVSGIKEPDERALGGCLRKLRMGDVIICSELSRLGRKLFMIMRILEHCMQIGAKLYTPKLVCLISTIVHRKAPFSTSKNFKNLIYCSVLLVDNQDWVLFFIKVFIVVAPTFSFFAIFL